MVEMKVLKYKKNFKHDFVYNLAYEGLNNMLKRWYKDSASEKIRRWTEDFMVIDKCPTCDGQRLKIESLHFKLDGKKYQRFSGDGFLQI